MEYEIITDETEKAYIYNANNLYLLKNSVKTLDWKIKRIIPHEAIELLKEVIGCL